MTNWHTRPVCLSVRSRREDASSPAAAAGSLCQANHNQSGVYYQWPSPPPPPDRTIEQVVIGLFLLGYGSAAAVCLMRVLGPHVAIAYPVPLLLHLLNDLADCYDPRNYRKPDTLVCNVLGGGSENPAGLIVAVYAITVLATVLIVKLGTTASYGSMLYTYALVAAVLGMSYEIGSPSPLALTVGVGLLGPFLVAPLVLYALVVMLLGKAVLQVEPLTGVRDKKLEAANL